MSYAKMVGPITVLSTSCIRYTGPGTADPVFVYHNPSSLHYMGLVRVTASDRTRRPGHVPSPCPLSRSVPGRPRALRGRGAASPSASPRALVTDFDPLTKAVAVSASEARLVERAGLFGTDTTLLESSDVFDVLRHVSDAWDDRVDFRLHTTYPRTGWVRDVKRGADDVFNDVCSECVTFTPVNWPGDHWTLLMFDLRRPAGCIYFVDPRGEAIPSQLRRVVVATFPGAELRCLTGRVQFDGHHCGIWCALVARLFILHCRLGRRPCQFRLSLFSDAVTVDAAPNSVSRVRNTAFVLGRRRHFRRALGQQLRRRCA